MNVLLWCPFIHLIDTPFQNLPYSHVQQTNWLMFDIFILLSIFSVLANKVAKPQQKKFFSDHAKSSGFISQNTQF